MTWQEIIRKHPNEDDYKLARRIVKEADPDELVKIIADRVGSERRLITLSAERAAFAPSKRIDLTPESRSRIEEVMATVRNESVVYEKGKPPVEWQDLTRDQIRRRIAMLTATRNGIDATIERLTLLLEFLETNGIDRYAEFEAKPARRKRVSAA